MAKLKKVFKFDKLPRSTKGPKGQRRRYLRATDVKSLPHWNKVVVNYITEPKTRSGEYYTKLTFFSCDADWQLDIRYFKDEDMLPLGKLLGVDSIDDTDQLLGVRCSINLGIRKGNDGREYIKIVEYSIDGDTTPTEQPTPQVASAIPDEDVPF